MYNPHKTSSHSHHMDSSIQRNVTMKKDMLYFVLYVLSVIPAKAEKSRPTTKMTMTSMVSNG